MGDRAVASSYDPSDVELARATCLYVATKLGSFLDDLVIVGGLVPSLLLPVEALPEGIDAHVGTRDVDIGLSVGLLDTGKYTALSDQLRSAGFVPDTNEMGNATRQRWAIEVAGARVVVDFLIPPSREEDRGGQLRDLESDFAAIITPGLELAFRDRERITLRGTTILGERAERRIWVCGPGAYIVLKALAFDGRGENKDAYDLHYVLSNFGADVDAVADSLRPIASDPATQTAIEILRRDFTREDAPGPRRVAEFITGGRDERIQADVVGFCLALLDSL